MEMEFTYFISFSHDLFFYPQYMQSYLLVVQLPRRY